MPASTAREASRRDARRRRGQWIALGLGLTLLAACSGSEAGRDLTEPPGGSPREPAPPAADLPYPPDQVLVRMAPGIDVEALNAYYGTRTIGRLAERRVFLLQCPAGSTVGDLLPRMASNRQVEAAEPNYRLEAPEAEARSTSSMTFADTRQGAAAFADQEALRRIRAFEAHSLARGSGVVVAVLDTGVDGRHPLIAEHLAPGGADLVDGDQDPSDRPDGIDSDGDGLVDEAVGHGTAVAGLVLSVAPEASILPVRILDSDGVGTAFAVARGIDVAARSSAGVVNMSFGMGQLSRIVRDLLDEAHDQGAVLVASAGNRNIAAPPQYPAADPLVLAVAATDSLDRKADFSNFGPWVGVSAPGVGLVTPSPGGGFAVWSGTSFSAALVSGEAALLRSASASGEGRRIPATILEGVVPLDGADPAFGRVLGSGRIDVLSALRQRTGEAVVGRGAAVSGAAGRREPIQP